MGELHVHLIPVSMLLTGPDSSVGRVSAPGNGRSRVRSRAATYQSRDRRDSSSGRASASCAVGQDGCRIDTWPRHTKDVIKMVPVATLLGAQHYKASTGFSSLKNHASLTLHN